MGFLIETKENFTLLKIEDKRATLAIAHDFKKFIVELILGGSTKLLIDLSEVEFLDSTFLGGLVLAHKKAAELKGAVCYTGLQKTVKTTFEITMLDKTLTIFDNVQQGTDYFLNL